MQFNDVGALAQWLSVNANLEQVNKWLLQNTQTNDQFHKIDYTKAGIYGVAILVNVNQGGVATKGFLAKVGMSMSGVEARQTTVYNSIKHHGLIQNNIGVDASVLFRFFFGRRGC